MKIHIEALKKARKNICLSEDFDFLVLIMFHVVLVLLSV